MQETILWLYPDTNTPGLDSKYKSGVWAGKQTDCTASEK